MKEVFLHYWFVSRSIQLKPILVGILDCIARLCSQPGAPVKPRVVQCDDGLEDIWVNIGVELGCPHLSPAALQQLELINTR